MRHSCHYVDQRMGTQSAMLVYNVAWESNEIADTDLDWIFDRADRHEAFDHIHVMQGALRLRLSHGEFGFTFQTQQRGSNRTGSEHLIESPC
ncbi:hypothetical protein D9M68_984800 [compost metagenome]